MVGLTRREGMLGVGLALATGPAWAEPDPWAAVPTILGRIRPPAIPKRDIRFSDFAPDPTGRRDCSAALRYAITHCHDTGGGRLIIERGDYLTGPIQLLSRVELHLAAGATLRFSTEVERYLPPTLSQWEGIELMGLSPLISAYGQSDIAITGEGVLDGGADEKHWWPWKGKAEFGWIKGAPEQEPARKRLFAMAEQGTPVAERIFGKDGLLRPQFFQPYRCKNVLIEGVTLLRSPMWQVTPTLCDNVIVRGLTIRADGPNTDGCDPNGCRDVLIEHCDFDTGDDCIAIKSGRNADGRRLARPTENVVIRQCRMRNGHGGLTIGSEISGGVRNVFAEDCTLDSPGLDIAIRVKNNALRGGRLEHLHFRRMTVGATAKAVITVDFNYEEGANGPYTPILDDFTVSQLTAKRSGRALDLQGLPKAPVGRVSITDCDFGETPLPPIVRHVTALETRNLKANGAPLRVT